MFFIRASIEVFGVVGYPADRTAAPLSRSVRDGHDYYSITQRRQIDDDQDRGRRHGRRRRGRALRDER